MKATEIMWDVDESLNGEVLPTEVDIPDEVIKGTKTLEEALEVVGDYLSDEYAMTHQGFSYEMDERDMSVITADSKEYE